MLQFQVKSIGRVRAGAAGMFLEIDREYRPALKELDGFSHLNILWWFSGCDNERSRAVLEVPSPYRKAPAVMGVFATRSPERPNPLALSTAQLLRLDHTNGIIRIAYIDAADGSPVLDLKPYTPSLDRVAGPEVPEWCGHWPKSLEESGAFDWEQEFNF
ncbi:tRNA-Thr(GGU) m(6)t(6)A37 methyltransferase TsaA [Hydrogenispora ethanolica]|uniref:tRNA-Thr(GGU) m(6)t(6)A37 methyltransferase TsaA n=1 Tax=Hydrogenispora ethanolica TaxID=1082276 RepID=A0A4R1RM33_HYDET|nr:SAM-dependent methyltransferase [Hydrogenispora ethanolica]TCL67318.1 tRNA-Thr(GGU) m(6)t(6)A37 methyltransferase TsaA [Hydrogenispora ethanolica]